MEIDQIRRIRKRTEDRKYIRRNREIVLDGKGVPKHIFEAGVDANIEPRVDMEIVPLHLSSDGNIFVYVTRREENDPFWPNARGLIGTAVRKSDVTEDRKLTKPWARIKSKELNKEDVSDPIFVDIRLDNTPRETEAALIYFIEVDNTLKGGEYLSINNLPSDLISHHYEYISLAVDKFKESKNIK